MLPGRGFFWDLARCGYGGFQVLGMRLRLGDLKKSKKERKQGVPLGSAECPGNGDREGGAQQVVCYSAGGKTRGLNASLASGFPGNSVHFL